MLLVLTVKRSSRKTIFISLVCKLRSLAHDEGSYLLDRREPFFREHAENFVERLAQSPVKKGAGKYRCDLTRLFSELSY